MKQVLQTSLQYLWVHTWLLRVCKKSSTQEIVCTCVHSSLLPFPILFSCPLLPPPCPPPLPSSFSSFHLFFSFPRNSPLLLLQVTLMGKILLRTWRAHLMLSWSPCCGSNRNSSQRWEVCSSVSPLAYLFVSFLSSTLDVIGI